MAGVGEGGETVLSCLVTDTASVDMVVFRAWVNGMAPIECARVREQALFASFFGSTLPEQLPVELQLRWRAARQLNFQECQDDFQVCTHERMFVSMSHSNECVLVWVF